MLKHIWWTALLGLLCQSHSQSSQRDHWGPWGDWSPCTKTCGGGTTSRIRQCVSLSRGTTPRRYVLKVYRDKRSCQGEAIQYGTCNTQNCYQAPKVTRKVAIKARAEQCTKFDNTSFNGYFFTWIPYLRVKTIRQDECQLNCLAKGHMFFLKLLPKVKDGTPCLTDLKKVCIDGKCKELPKECQGGGCFGQKSSVKPKQRRSGVFTSKDVRRGKLILGYNPIITIPAGATNINVTEIRRSKNYLALKSHDSNKYYINGNWVVDPPRRYNVAGTTCYYSRPRRNTGNEVEAFIAAGPTTEDLDVMLLYQNDEPQIKYSYLLPRNYPNTQHQRGQQAQQPAEPAPIGHRGLVTQPTQPASNRNAHAWRLTGFTQCTHSCAGGIQKTVHQCVSLADNSVVEQSLCSADPKPPQRQRVCNLQSCPPRWEPGGWGKCSKTCGAGLQIRNLRCKQLVDNNGQRQQQMLPISYCRQWQRPVPSRSCNLQPCPLPANWTVGEWGKCSVTCQRGVKQRAVRCVDISNSLVNESFCSHTQKPSAVVSCFAGSCKMEWFASNKWSHCSVLCGKGEQSRPVMCGRKGGDAISSDHCSQENKPSTTRQCNIGKCQAIWVASDWSTCSVDCGRGTQVRSVFCAGVDKGRYQEFPDEACPSSSKPASVQPCSSRISCKPQWFTTKWGKCSRSCGGGSQVRKVTCLNHEGKASRDCSSRNRPLHYQRCNNTPCPTSSEYLGQVKNCHDIYTRGLCFYVIQANFCQYSHYHRMCCNSCQRRQ